MVLLFDAANTLIHKPSLFHKIKEVLIKYGYNLDLSLIKYHHKIISELIHFPDKTNSAFYEHFNKELLYTLGIVPEEQMLKDIFSACSYLTWEKFKDIEFLTDSGIKMFVLSNFHGGLTEILSNLFPNYFSELIISEKERIRKPDIEFYFRAIERIGINPADIIYIGDSVKLDLEPALAVGMNAWLIDRDNFYPLCKRRISSFSEIGQII